MDRTALRLIGLLGSATLALAVVACGDDSSTTSAAAAATSTTSTSTISSTSTGGAAVDPTRFNGTYNGNWKNTTFGSTGSAKAVVTVDTAAKSFTIVLTLGGNVFGGAPPGPATLAATYTGNSASGTGTSPVFGPYNLSISADGTLTLTSKPGGRVADFSATGKISSTSVNLTYTAKLSDGTAAQGTVTLSK